MLISVFFLTAVDNNNLMVLSWLTCQLSTNLTKLPAVLCYKPYKEPLRQVLVCIGMQSLSSVYQ